MPAFVPAGAVVLYSVADITTATIPTNWTRYTQAEGRYILGTATQAEIDTNVAAVGNVNVSATISSDGSHFFTTVTLHGSGSQTTSSSQSPMFFGTLSGGTHTHTAISFDCSAAMANTCGTPMISCATRLDKLPPNAIVFRKIKPTSISYSDYRPSGNGYFYGSTTRTWVDRTGTGTGVGSTSQGGLHNHGSFGSYFTGGNFGTQNEHGTNGAHTHTVQVQQMVASLKGKELKAWVSSQEETVEYGMILMYRGNLGQLPAGWRVCDGTLGTPDMVDQFIGYTSAEIHDNVISTTSTVNVHNSNCAISSVDADHGHFGTTRTNSSGHSGQHTTSSWVHAHTVASTSFLSFNTPYTPASRRLAFIQYKGI